MCPSLWPTRLPPGFSRRVWPSSSLRRKVEFILYQPESASTCRLPTLYLLHGSGHSPATVLRDVRPQSCLVDLGEALLVIPDGRQGWWLDSPIIEHSRYESYLLELVRFVESEYPVAANRESRGLCGFSMGGFGAMHLAARHAEHFGSASSLLGPLDIVQWHPEYYRLARLLGRDLATWREHNPTECCAHLANTSLRFSTGSEAVDRPQNDAFARALDRLAIAHEYEIYPGMHDAAWVRAHLAADFAFHRRCFSRRA